MCHDYDYYDDDFYHDDDLYHDGDLYYDDDFYHDDDLYHDDITKFIIFLDSLCFFMHYHIHLHSRDTYYK